MLFESIKMHTQIAHRRKLVLNANQSVKAHIFKAQLAQWRTEKRSKERIKIRKFRLKNLVHKGVDLDVQML